MGSLDFSAEVVPLAWLQHRWLTLDGNLLIPIRCRDVLVGFPPSCRPLLHRWCRPLFLGIAVPWRYSPMLICRVKTLEPRFRQLSTSPPGNWWCLSCSFATIPSCGIFPSGFRWTTRWLSPASTGRTPVGQGPFCVSVPGNFLQLC